MVGRSVVGIEGYKKLFIVQEIFFDILVLVRLEESCNFYMLMMKF